MIYYETRYYYSLNTAQTRFIRLECSSPCDHCLILGALLVRSIRSSTMLRQVIAKLAAKICDICDRMIYSNIVTNSKSTEKV